VAKGASPTVRFRVRKGSIGLQDLVFGSIAVETVNLGDFVLLRSDGSAQYNLACVTDDRAMQVTHVIRGEGHLSNTFRQILLYEAFDCAPPEFAHLSTILGPDGNKLSKRHGATSIAEFRGMGYLPEGLINYLALLGWTPSEEHDERLRSSELIEQFHLAGVTKSPATFDIDKLNWLNRFHLKHRSRDEIAALAEPFFVSDGLFREPVDEKTREFSQRLCTILLKYVDTLQDFPLRARDILEFDVSRELATPEVQEILLGEGAQEVIRLLYKKLARVAGQIDQEAYREAVARVKEESGQKGKNLFRPVRVAVTGRASGPELDAIIPVVEEASLLSLGIPVKGIRDRIGDVLATLEDGSISAG
jgi:glutamyl-tRNA synthetase